jgi:hypothetical protein
MYVGTHSHFQIHFAVIPRMNTMFGGSHQQLDVTMREVARGEGPLS